MKRLVLTAVLLTAAYAPQATAMFGSWSSSPKSEEKTGEPKETTEEQTMFSRFGSWVGSWIWQNDKTSKNASSMKSPSESENKKEAARETTISIEGINKIMLVQALYENLREKYAQKDLPKNVALRVVTNKNYITDINGVPICMDIENSKLYVSRYNKERRGAKTAEEIIKTLREK